MTTGPWTQRDLTVWGATVAVAAVACLWSWWNLAATVRLDEQTPYPSLSIFAVAAASCGHVAWVARGRRAVGRRLAQLLTGIDVPAAPPTSSSTAAIPSAPAARPVAGKGLRHYHRPDCAMAAGRRWRGATVARHEAAGRRPCGICQP